MTPRRFVLSLVLLWLLILVLLHLHTPAAHAADAPQARPDITVDAATRAAVIEGVAQKIESRYVFPDLGKKIASSSQGMSAMARTLERVSS